MNKRSLEELLRQRGRSLDEVPWLTREREAEALAAVRRAARNETRETPETGTELRRGWSFAAGLLAAAAAVVLFFSPRATSFRTPGSGAPGSGAPGSVALYDSGGRPLSASVRGEAEIVEAFDGEVLVEVVAGEPSWVSLVLYACEPPAAEAGTGTPGAHRALGETLNEPLPAGEARLLRLPVADVGETAAFVLVVALTPGRLPRRIFDARFPVVVPGVESAESLAAELARRVARLGAERGEFFVLVLRARGPN